MHIYIYIYIWPQHNKYQVHCLSYPIVTQPLNGLICWSDDGGHCVDQSQRKNIPEIMMIGILRTGLNESAPLVSQTKIYFHGNGLESSVSRYRFTSMWFIIKKIKRSYDRCDHRGNHSTFKITWTCFFLSFILLSLSLSLSPSLWYICI